MMSISGRLCRICLSTELQGKSVLESRAQWLLYEVAGIQVVDARLSCVCYNCQHLLNKWANFKKLCLKADGLIRELLEKQHGQQHVDVDVEAAIREWKRDVHNRQYLYSISPSRTVRTSISPNTPSQGQADADEPREQAWAAEHVKLEYTSDKDCDSVHHAQDKPELHIKAEGTDNPGEEGWAQHTDDDDDYTPLSVVKTNSRPAKSNKCKTKMKRRRKSDTNKNKPLSTFAKVKHEVTIDEMHGSEFRMSPLEQEQDLQQRRRDEGFLRAQHKCESCALTFKNVVTLENHMKKHNPSRGQHLCPLCLQYFKTELRLRVHRDLHALRLLCLSCGARLRDRQRLAEHIACHRGDMYQCEQCPQNFQRKSTYYNHLRLQHYREKLQCDLCDNSYNTKHKLEEHMRRHSGSRPFSCSVCGASFFSSSNLQAHHSTHTASRQHYCVECDLHFKSALSLRAHLTHSRPHLDPSTLKYECSKCPRKYPTEKQLLAHTGTQHLQLKSFGCEVCGGRYATRQGLNYHRRHQHQGHQLPRQHACPHCQKTFTSKALLVNHIRVHTGERPFECSQCQRRFNQKASLRTHIKLVHLKIKRGGRKAEKAQPAGYTTGLTNK